MGEAKKKLPALKWNMKKKEAPVFTAHTSFLFFTFGPSFAPELVSDLLEDVLVSSERRYSC